MNRTASPRAQRPVPRNVPQDTYEQLRPSYIEPIKRLFSLGITSFESATTTIDDEPVGKGGIADPGPVPLTFKRLREIAARPTSRG